MLGFVGQEEFNQGDADRVAQVSRDYIYQGMRPARIVSPGVDTTSANGGFMWLYVGIQTSTME